MQQSIQAFLSDLRSHKMNVWGIKDNANVDERITAYINYSKKCCRFNPDYNSGLGYHDFINDLLDYPSSRKSAMNALCALVSYCVRSKIFRTKVNINRNKRDICKYIENSYCF